MAVNLAMILLMLDENKAKKLKDNPNLDINDLMPLGITNEKIFTEVFNGNYVFRNSDYVSRFAKNITEIEKYVKNNKKEYDGKCYYIDFVKKN